MYTFKVLDLLKGEHKTEEYEKINPNKTVPTMVDGEIIINESRVIAAFLVNKYGPDSNLY